MKNSSTPGNSEHVGEPQGQLAVIMTLAPGSAITRLGASWAPSWPHFLASLSCVQGLGLAVAVVTVLEPGMCLLFK